MFVFFCELIQIIHYATNNKINDYVNATVKMVNNNGIWYADEQLTDVKTLCKPLIADAPPVSSNGIEQMGKIKGKKENFFNLHSH